MRYAKRYERASVQLTKYLKARHLRQSFERDYVLQKCCEKPSRFTLGQIIEDVKEQSISRSSVYNAVNLFMDANILRKSKLDPNMTQTYELVPNHRSRIVLVCTHCQKEVSIKDEGLYKQLQARNYLNFVMERYTLYIYGHCKVCHGLELRENLKKAPDVIEIAKPIENIEDGERISNES